MLSHQIQVTAILFHGDYAIALLVSEINKACFYLLLFSYINLTNLESSLNFELEILCMTLGHFIKITEALYCG